eukprot:8099867-Pyramimonas_sp.AAC.1
MASLLAKLIHISCWWSSAPSLRIPNAAFAGPKPTCMLSVELQMGSRNVWGLRRIGRAGRMWAVVLGPLVELPMGPRIV